MIALALFSVLCSLPSTIPPPPRSRSSDGLVDVKFVLAATVLQGVEASASVAAASLVLDAVLLAEPVPRAFESVPSAAVRAPGGQPGDGVVLNEVPLASAPVRGVQDALGRREGVQLVVVSVESGHLSHRRSQTVAGDEDSPRAILATLGPFPAVCPTARALDFLVLVEEALRHLVAREGASLPTHICEQREIRKAV